jgi:hypothetical protein
MKRILFSVLGAMLVAAVALAGSFEDLFPKTHILPNIAPFATGSLPGAPRVVGRLAFDSSLGTHVSDNGTAWRNVAMGTATTFKVSAMQITLDGSNPSSASHGLTSVVACSATNVRTTAPTNTTEGVLFTYVVNGAAIDLYAWRFTANGDTTLLASGDADDVIGVVCLGT